MRIADLSTIDTNEIRTITFDYLNYLSPSQALSGVPTLFCTTLVGVDLLAQARLIGAPQIIASPANGRQGASVSQQIGQMVGGVTYVIQCVVPAPPDIPSLWAQLPCDLPSPTSFTILPASPSGLIAGMLWSNGGVVCIAGTVPADWPISPIGLLPGTLWSNGGVVCIAGTPPNWPTSPTNLTPGSYWSNGGVVCISGLISRWPTTPAGLLPGSYWNDGGVLSVVGPVPGMPTTPYNLVPGTFWTNNGVVSVIGVPAGWPVSPIGLPSSSLWINNGVVSVV